MNKFRSEMIGTAIFAAVVFVILVGAWTWNAVKLSKCDFEPSTSYKCEVIHGAGLFVPPLALATVWFDSEAK